MYPFACSSFSHLRNACLFFSGSGYILQLLESGVLGLNLMVWSHGRNGGKQCDSSSLNTLVCHWYSSGISILGALCLAVRARSVAVVCMVVVSSSCCMMALLSGWVSARAITGVFRGILMLMVRMMMGRAAVLMVAVLQAMWGSKVASHGYPRMMSSPPRSVMRNCISL